MSKFEVLVDASNEPKAKVGSVVYSPRMHDYGIANDDTRSTGIQHVSVTLEPDGGYPVFTIPEKDLKRLE